MTAALEITPADDWTEDGLTTFDLEELPADGRRRELVDGVLHMPPSPGWAHQTLAMLLGARLHAACPVEFAVTQAVETGAHHSVIETDEPWPIRIPIKEISPR
jgi:hypothetical protein